MCVCVCGTTTPTAMQHALRCVRHLTRAKTIANIATLTKQTKRTEATKQESIEISIWHEVCVGMPGYCYHMGQTCPPPPTAPYRNHCNSHSFIWNAGSLAALVVIFAITLRPRARQPQRQIQLPAVNVSANIKEAGLGAWEFGIGVNGACWLMRT